VIALKFPWKERLSRCNKFYLSPVVCINPKPLSFIIGNTDIDLLNSHLPMSSPITPVLNVVSVGAEMTVACEIPLNLFAMKLILTFINSNLSVNQGEGPVQEVVDFLQHPSILTGSCLLQNFILFLITLYRSSKF